MTTSSIAEQLEAGISAPLWEFVRTLKRRRKRPKIAAAPIIDRSGQVVSSKEAILALWIQQFSLEFSGQVVGVTEQGLQILLAERKQLGDAIIFALRRSFNAVSQLCLIRRRNGFNLFSASFLQ